MAGQVDSSSSTGQTGPIAGRPAAGRPRPASQRPAYPRVPIRIGEYAPTVEQQVRAAPVAAPLPADVLPRVPQTQAAYRQLVAGGLDGADAAELIGYVVGLPASGSRWSLEEINLLLFLRDLYLNTDWGTAERRPG